MSEPYRTTPVFDETTLPAALRRDHSTKAGVWGVIQVLEGAISLTTEAGEERVLTPGRPGVVRPEEKHRVEPLGCMRMRVEFYDCPPAV